MVSQLRVTFAVLVFASCTAIAWGMDYVRLRSGQVVEGAILRQDSIAIFMTDWDSRGLPQPPLSVYTRDEVHSIWFVDPSGEGTALDRYTPHSGSFELGGSLSFQNWAESRVSRRSQIQTSLQGGYSFTRALGFDVSADFTVPLGGEADTTWRRFDPAYQIAMSVVIHPFVWKGLIPYAIAGGGAALGTPVNGTILAAKSDMRSLVNAGLGVKWGVEHLGARLEWRHHFYAWTPDEVDDREVRVDEQTADASVIRVGLFYFR